MAQAKKSSGSAGHYAASGQHPAHDMGQHDIGEGRRAGESAAAQEAVHELRQAGAEVAPQLGTVAAVAVATALVEAELLPAVLIGAGAALLPKLLPGVGYALRPVLRTVVRAGYSAVTAAQQWAAEAGEQVQDVVAEVQAEQRSARRRAEADLEEHTSAASEAAATAGTTGS